MTRYEELLAVVDDAKDTAQLQQVLSETIEALKADLIMAVGATKVAKAVDTRLGKNNKAKAKHLHRAWPVPAA
jgi:hypothetical protein